MATRQLTLLDHPRLYAGEKELARLSRQPRLPFLCAAAEHVRDQAEAWVSTPPLTYRRNVHNEHLVRAREIQTRIVTLLVRWRQTGEKRFRRAVLKHVEEMAAWQCWSWITWRKGNYRPTAIYDLSYGENATTLAIVYDWLYDTLTDTEKRLLIGLARKWPFAAGLIHGKRGKAWWFGHAESNWNTVCAGGLGMLALAMYEDVPEARRSLQQAEKSVVPYMRHLDRTNGAWPEGIGYWNYGMRYAFMYLLSHEHATGRPHPLLALPGVRRTLAFPLDFCPNAQPCSFGDVNHWGPLPFHHAVAARLCCRDVVAALDAELEQRGPAAMKGGWASAAEWLFLHTGRRAAARQTVRRKVARIYKGLDWAIMADRWPRPRLYMAVRGGTTRVPHGHRDLLSFHCVVGDERLITNQCPSEYLDTTFSPRREEIWAIGPASKNTILINGVGIESKSTLDSTEKLRVGGHEAVRLIATTAMGGMRDGLAVKFCGRLIIMLHGRAFLIIDRAELPHPGRMESRLHTAAQVKALKAGAILRGEKERLRVSCASNVPAVFRTAAGALTTPPAAAPAMLRWCTQKLHTNMVLATLLTPGAKTASVSVEAHTKGMTVTTVVGGVTSRLKLTKVLRPARKS